jgi:hypothetical protein
MARGNDIFLLQASLPIMTENSFSFIKRNYGKERDSKNQRLNQFYNVGAAFQGYFNIAYFFYS